MRIRNRIESSKISRDYFILSKSRVLFSSDESQEVPSQSNNFQNILFFRSWLEECIRKTYPKKSIIDKYLNNRINTYEQIEDTTS